MLKLGSSKPWPEALEMVAGQNYMDASAVLDYYKPLYDWLRVENAKAEEPIGWKETGMLRNQKVDIIFVLWMIAYDFLWFFLDEPLCVAAWIRRRNSLIVPVAISVAMK